MPILSESNHPSLQGEAGARGDRPSVRLQGPSGRPRAVRQEVRAQGRQQRAGQAPLPPSFCHLRDLAECDWLSEGGKGQAAADGSGADPREGQERLREGATQAGEAEERSAGEHHVQPVHGREEEDGEREGGLYFLILSIIIALSSVRKHYCLLYLYFL